MTIAELSAFFAMGLGLGMLHAFDPDHLAAVGGIASGNLNHNNSTLGRQPLNTPWQYAIHWSLGHGSSLFAIALMVLLIGTVIPTQVSHLAEQSVALVLIIIGGHALWRITEVKPTRPTRRSLTGASMVGLLHGTAGSAPLLALIPLSRISHPAVGLVYVLFFSAGVTIAMTSIGGAMTQVIRQIGRFDTIWQQSLQVGLALFSLILGIYLLFS